MWNKVLKSGGVLFSGVVITNGFMFVFRYTAIRNLSTADYGKLALIISLFSSLLVFAHFSNDMALSKFFSESRDRETRFSYLYNAILLSLITTSIAACAMQLYIINLDLFSPFLAFCVFAGFYCLAVAIILSGALVGLFEMRLAAAVGALNAGIRVLLIILFVALGLRSLAGAGVAYFGAAFVPLFFSIAMVRSKIGPFFHHRRRKIVDIDVMRKVVNFSKFITAASFLLYMMWFFSRWSLGSYKSAAVFDAAALMYSVFQMAFGSFVVAIVPHVSEWNAANRTLRIPSIRKPLLVYLAALVLFMVARAYSIDQYLITLIGLGKYTPSLPLFYIMFLVAPLDVLFGTCSGILQGLNKTKNLFQLVAIAFPVHIVGTFVLVKIVGVYGAAIMFVLTYSLLGFLGYVKVKRMGIIAQGGEV